MEKMRSFKKEELVRVNRDTMPTLCVAAAAATVKVTLKDPSRLFTSCFCFSDTVWIKATVPPQISSVLVLAATEFCSACVTAESSPVWFIVFVGRET